MTFPAGFLVGIGGSSGGRGPADTPAVKDLVLALLPVVVAGVKRSRAIVCSPADAPAVMTENAELRQRIKETVATLLIPSLSVAVGFIVGVSVGNAVFAALLL